MIIIPIICISLIWAALIYGFAHDDMGVGILGRAFSGLAHAGMVALSLGAIGLLLNGSVLIIQAAVS